MIAVSAFAAPARAHDPKELASAHSRAPASYLWSGLESRLTAFQARTASELFQDEISGVRAIDRPATLDGLRLSTRYHPWPWLTLELDATALRARYRDQAREPVAGAAERYAMAGATFRNGKLWSASLFVSYLGSRPGPEEDDARLRSSSTVSAQVSTRLGKHTRINFDVLNVFNQRAGEVDYFAGSRLWTQPGTLDGFLFHPAEPRGFRIRVRTRF